MSIPPSTEAPSSVLTESTTPSSETPKSPEKSDGKAPAKSLLNEPGAEEKGAPEKYEDFKVPEGFTLDEEIAKDAGALFKKHGLSQAAAQELVDFYVKQTKEAFDAPFNAYQEKRQEWRDQINSDPEIGGTRLNGVKASIGKLINSFGSTKIAEGFRDAMDYTGAGDNPDVVRGLYALSKLLNEGGAVRGNGPIEVSRDGTRASTGGPLQPSTAQAIYPHLPSNRG